MKIDLERFLALTAMLAAPLVTANGCIITGTGTDDGATNGTSGADDAVDDASDPTGSPTSADDAPGTEGSGTDGGTDGGTETGTTGVDDTAGSSSGAVDSTGGNELGNCCEVHAGTGCDVTEVSDCVCAEDPFCCETEWDINCIMQVNNLGCGVCELPPQAWDCSCLAACDDTPVDTIWQVCSGDRVDAATMGTAACEMDLDAQCTTFVCDECSCFTSEVPEIDCP